MSRGPLLTWPSRLWWSSLPLRVVATTLALAAIVLASGGWIIDRRVVDGVLDAKRKAAGIEAQQAFDIAQSALSDPGLSSDSIDQQLTQVAKNAALRGGVSRQYEVIIEAHSARIQPSSTFAGDPVPQALRDALVSPQQMYVTPTEIRYREGLVTPGLAIGALLEVQGGNQRFPMFFIFPLNNEERTIDMLRGAIGTVLIVLLAALGAVTYAVSRTVVNPVRAAADAAAQMTAGNLDARLPVKGTDDLAQLGTSMNTMAAALKKQLSSYEELSRVQRQFVSDVSHELRTPLTTVRMAADMLYEAREEYDGVTKRSAELMHDELDRFDSLLSDLLEISRFDAGAAVLTTEEVDIAELVRSEVEQHRAFAQRMNTDLKLLVTGDTVPGNLTAEVDSRRVRRILRNLLTNAIEHAEEKPIEVTVRASGEAVAITVRDHGVGFEASQAAKVFHRFWRGDPARARMVGGTGLGLAISLEDATLHGGWLNAWGRPGLGAKFRITLPRRQGEPLHTSPLPLSPSGERGIA